MLPGTPVGRKRRELFAPPAGPVHRRHELMDQTRERAAGLGMEFLLVNRSILVGIGGVEERFDKGEIFILA